MPATKDHPLHYCVKIRCIAVPLSADSCQDPVYFNQGMQSFSKAVLYIFLLLFACGAAAQDYGGDAFNITTSTIATAHLILFTAAIPKR